MFYRLRHTFVAVPVGDGALLFRSDTRSFKVEGSFAELLSARLLTELDGRRALHLVAEHHALPVADLQQNLDALVEAGVMERGSEPIVGTPADPRLNLIDALTAGPGVGRQRLDSARLAVFGTSGLGRLVAEQLAGAGFRQLLLVDPPGTGEAGLDRALRDQHAGVSVTTAGRDGLDRARVRDLMGEIDLAIACWDRGYDAGNHWVNRAAIELNRPALFSAVGGIQAFAGPFVVPGMTACYMCAKMRAVAVQENADEAMASERFFDQLKTPGFAHREFLATSLSVLAGLIVTDAYKYVVLQYQPALLGHIIEFDPMTLTLQRHALLEQPQCPVCSAKKKTSHVIIPAWTSSDPSATSSHPSQP